MKQEIWKDVTGYEGLYQVSNLGRVRSLTRYKRIMTGHINTWRYRQVTLTKNKIKKMFSVHRLVAEAFIPNPENKPEVDHINTLRDDNRVENLRWVSSSENSLNPITRRHKSAALLGKKASELSRKKMSVSSSKKVNQYDLSGKFIKTWGSIKDAAAFYGRTATLIRTSIKDKHHIFENSQWRLYDGNTLDIAPFEERHFSRIRVIFDNGSDIIFNSIADASKNLVVSRRTIYNYLQSKIKNQKYKIYYV